MQVPILEYRPAYEDENDEDEAWDEFVVIIGDHELLFYEAEEAIATLAALEEFGTMCFRAGLAIGDATEPK